jgi:hypothetical protein
MTHHNAPLTVEGRRRLVQRCRDRPIAHVAAEMGISRACASKWVNRYRRFGDLGLLSLVSAAAPADHNAHPCRSPDRSNATTMQMVSIPDQFRALIAGACHQCAYGVTTPGGARFESTPLPRSCRPNESAPSPHRRAPPRSYGADGAPTGRAARRPKQRQDLPARASEADAYTYTQPSMVTLAWPTPKLSTTRRQARQ